jgi:ribosomal protein S3
MTAIGFFLIVLAMVVLHHDEPLNLRERISNALTYAGTAIGTAGVCVWLWKVMP